MKIRFNLTQNWPRHFLTAFMRFIRETHKHWDTCPGPDTGVEAPEWLGEFGRDLQEARRAACFLAATILWVTKRETSLSKLTLSSWLKVTCYLSPYFKSKLTFIKYSVHIKSIGGTGLIVSAATHIYTQLLDSLVLNHTGVSATNLICRIKKAVIELVRNTILINKTSLNPRRV